MATITFLATMAATSVFSQGRDFRRERAALAREEKEERHRMRREHIGKANVDYGTNILRLSPLTIMDVGVGFGISYEKILDKNQMIGLILPLHLMLDSRDNDFFSNSSTLNSTQSYIYFTPGLKIYPFGQRKVTYAIGPSLMMGYGGGKEWRYDNYTPGYEEQVDVKRFRLGMLVNNYVNFQVGPSFNLGLELGIGIRYMDRETVKYTTFSRTENHDLEPTGQFSMTLGYRF